MDCTNNISTSDLFSGTVGKDANGIPAIKFKEVTFASAIPCESPLSKHDLLKNVIDYDATCGIHLRVVLGTADCGGQCQNIFMPEGDITMNLFSSVLVMATDGLPAIYLAELP